MSERNIPASVEISDKPLFCDDEEPDWDDECVHCSCWEDGEECCKCGESSY